MCIAGRQYANLARLQRNDLMFGTILNFTTFTITILTTVETDENSESDLETSFKPFMIKD